MYPLKPSPLVRGVYRRVAPVLFCPGSLPEDTFFQDLFSEGHGVLGRARRGVLSLRAEWRCLSLGHR